MNASKGVRFLGGQRLIGNSRFGKMKAIAAARGLGECLEEGIVRVKVPVNIVVFSQDWNKAAVVKMRMGVHERHHPPLWEVLFFSHRSVFGARRPIRARPLKAVNPVNKALGFISPVDDDGVAVGSVGDHGAPHLEGADEKVFNPWFGQSHDRLRADSFMRLSHQSHAPQGNRWSTSPGGQPHAVQTGAALRGVSV